MTDIKFHKCEGKLPRLGLGEMITECTEQPDGRLLVGADGTYQQVNFCCYCGYEAKKKVALKK